MQTSALTMVSRIAFLCVLAGVVSSSDASSRVSFAGFDWDVLDSHGKKVAPGPNVFDPALVAVDGTDLKLSIVRDRASQVVLKSSLGYGSYAFTTQTPVDDLGDPNLVLGMFLYKDDTHELDIEFTRWGQQESSHNADYVVQPNPNGQASRKARFWAAPHAPDTVHTIDFRNDRVRFFSRLRNSTEACAPPAEEFRFHNASEIPVPDGMKVSINLWRFHPKTDGNSVKPKANLTVVFSNFSFTPALSINIV